MLLRYLFCVAGFFLVACSGNNSSSVTTPDTSLKRFSGVVNNSSVSGATISAIPVGNHGQFRKDENNEIDAVSLSSDEDGRYGILLKIEEDGAFIVSATAPNADTEAEVQPAPANMQCQVVAGCLVTGNLISFGSLYPMPAKDRWSAAVEFVSDGQFVVINPITEMATLLGFSTYVGSSDDTEIKEEGSVAAPGYYSNYGIAKGNSQTAALFGLTDIISVEPINLFSLHNISISSSTSLQDSIRYGALLAAWESLELNYNSSILEGDFSFREEVVFEYVSNQGQLYQAEPLDNQKLSMKSLYEAAASNLSAARDFHMSLSRSIPNEVNLVIDKLEQEAERFQDGVLTSAESQITKQLIDDYSDAILKSKAMVNYISDLSNNFADEEYRNSVQEASTLATDEIKRLSPKFDILMQQLLAIQEYYLSCASGSCDVASPWHGGDNIYSSENKSLTIVQSEDAKLELSQAMVFDSASPEGSTATNSHDLFITGAIEFDGLRFELSDFSSDSVATIKSGIRSSFPKVLSELPEHPDLIEGGKGARVDEGLVPDAIELALPSFKLYDKSLVGADKELTVSGGLSALMIANVDSSDFIEGKDDKDKLGKRYNLANVSSTLTVAGSKQGELEDGTELRDSAVLSVQAVASESVISEGNLAAYFPDTVYPTFESFFKPRENFSVGDESPSALVVSRRGVMNFPKLDTEGVASEEEVISVDYLELDYEVGGLERYVVYPKIGDDDQYWGLVCSATAEDEKDLIGPEWTKTVKDDEGKDVIKVLLTCGVRQKFSGESTPDSLINSVYAINKDFVNLREYNGQGVYRVAYDLEVKGKDDEGEDIVGLSDFSDAEDTHGGVIEQTIVLGVDSMRLQFKPELVNDAATKFLPETVFDVSLVWRRHDLIDVNIFLAFNADENYNNPNGTGLPYLGVGSDVESYSIAYRTDENGNELGEYVFAWSGVQFVDGPIGSDGKPIKVMQRTSDESLKEGFIAGIGSNVEYRDYTQREQDALDLSAEEIAAVQEEKCGFFDRGQKTEGGENCSAIAYLTFRGLVTGVLREEQDGVYVIRYIDGSWQAFGN